MLTIHEVSELAGVSVRTLHHYDAIGLLAPGKRTAAGYRLYGEADLARLQQILLLRELEFPLKDIRAALEAPAHCRAQMLGQQIRLLEMKREHIDALIALARQMADEEEQTVSFEAFDTRQMDEYAAKAKAAWGATPAWQDYERRSAGRSKGEERAMGEELLALFAPFGQMAAAGADATGEEARAQAARIQAFISERFYHCTDEVFAELGKAYGAGGDFTRTIDAAAGEGAGAFASRAVEAYLREKR